MRDGQFGSESYKNLFLMNIYWITEFNRPDVCNNARLLPPANNLKKQANHMSIQGKLCRFKESFKKFFSI
jgi:hypothetical protein